VTGGFDGAIHLWDVAMAKHLGQLRMAEIGPINSLCFSPDGRSLTASSEHLSQELRKIVGTARTWDMAGAKVRRDLKLDNRGSVIAYSPDNLRLAVADSDMGDGPGGRDLKSGNSIQIFDMLSGDRQVDLQGHTRPIVAITFSPDGKKIASASEDNTIRFWDPKIGREIRRITIEGHVHTDKNALGKPAHVFQATIAADLGHAVTSGMWDDRLIVWDLTGGKALHTIRLAKNLGALVAFAPNGRTFASASTLCNNPVGDDWTIRLWDAVEGREVLQLNPQGLRVSAMTFTSDGRSLVTGMNDTTTLVWDVSAAYATKPAKAD
jgi:WD40 repeat protein